MTNETRKEIIKALAYGLDTLTILGNTTSGSTHNARIKFVREV